MPQLIGNCVACFRLATYLKQIRSTYPYYHGLPVAAFGPDNAGLLIVGLAPGLHGANATGRPFTGDASGDLLFKVLHACKLSSAERSISIDDGLILNDCRITNAVKCLPPENKPVGSEINQCNVYLQQELGQLQGGRVAIALGQISHKAVLKACGETLSHYKFGHNRLHHLNNGIRLLDSYHCSRYNIQTGRLTYPMFKQVFDHAVQLLESP